MQKHFNTIWKKRSILTPLQWYALLSGLIYLAFTLPFPLTRYYIVNPPVDYAKLTSHSPLGLTAYIVGILTLFGLYGVTLRILTQGKSHHREQSTWQFLLLSSAMFGLILLFSYPQMAIDIFVYAIRTRGWALYDLSPFTTAPEAFPVADPWLGLAGEWIDAASPYGPVWELLSLGVYHLSSSNYLFHLLTIKFVGLLSYLGSAWLVYRILRLTRPQWSLAGLAFFAWNPLVLFESVQNAHNDMLMIFFLLLAIWAYVRLITEKSPSKWLAGLFIGAFVLSILVKFVTLLILPFFLLGWGWQQSTWLRRIVIVLGYGLLIVLIAVLGMLPYWPGLENWAVLQAGQGAGRSFFALIVLTLLPKVSSTAVAFDITTVLVYTFFGVIYLWGLWQILSSKPLLNEPEKLLEITLRVSFYSFFWYVLGVASVFHAWYLLWFLPLAALLIPAKRSTSVTWTFSLAALLIIPYYETIRVWIPYLNQNHWLGHLIGVSLLLIPVLLALWKPLRFLPKNAHGRDKT